MTEGSDLVGQAASNRRLLQRLLIVVAIMGVFGYALVPFYNKICEVAGLRNVDEAGAVPLNTQVDATRSVGIEFDSNLKDLAWDFKPVTPHIDVHPGAVTQVMFEVRNRLDVPITGQAIPSFAPQLAVKYFTKVECFCFRSQTLAAHETRQMPVVFVVDPKLPKGVDTITLSYTFFEVNGSRSAG
jgi:cytochrome c oxidase assembly protein subunit 11